VDQVFRALADPSRRRLPGRLNQRTGQTWAQPDLSGIFQQLTA
jgi:hypothetical protein